MIEWDVIIVELRLLAGIYFSVYPERRRYNSSHEKGDEKGKQNITGFMDRHAGYLAVLSVSQIAKAFFSVSVQVAK